MKTMRIFDGGVLWSKRDHAALLVMLILHFFSQLGSRGLNEPDEGRFAEMSREMLVSGDWLVPRIVSVPHYAKPPVTNWLAAVSMKVFGVNEFAARLPSALAAILLALVLFDIARRAVSIRAGLYAVMIQATFLEVFAGQRMITTDMLLSSTTATAIWCAWRLRSAGSLAWRWRAAFWVTLGVAFMIKGPPALGIVFLALVGEGLISRSKSGLASLGWVWGPPVFLAIALPWFLSLIAMKPDLVDFFVGREIVERVTTGTARTKPFWFFPLVLAIGSWPWLPYLIAAVADVVKDWRRGAIEPRRRAILALAISWFVLPFAMFCIAKSKLWTYLMPLYAPLALLLGERFDHWLESRDAAPRNLPKWSTCIYLPCIAAVVLKTHWVHDADHDHILVVFGAIIVVAVLLCHSLTRIREIRRRKQAEWSFIGLVAAALLHLLAYSAGVFEADLANNSSWRSAILGMGDVPWRGAPLDRRLEASPELPVFSEGGVRLATWKMRFHAASFYALGTRAEYVPEYGSGTIWEMESHRRNESVPILDDLAAALRSAGPMAVLTKASTASEVLAICPELVEVHRIGTGRQTRVVLANPSLVRWLDDRRDH